MTQRYEFIENTPWENPTGKWVRHIDHSAELATIRDEVESARESFAMLYEMLRDNPTYDIAAGVAKSGLDRTKEALK